MRKILIKLISFIIFICIIYTSTSFAGLFSGNEREDAELLYNKINEFLEEAKDCPPEDFEDFCCNYFLTHSQKPTVVDEEDFYKDIENKILLYRGLSIKNYADDMKSGKVYICKNVNNIRGNGIYTTSNLECAKLFAVNGSRNIVKMHININDLISEDKIVSIKYLHKVIAFMYNNHKDELQYIFNTPKDDLKFDSENTFSNEIFKEFLETGLEKTMKNFNKFFEEYIRDHAEEYEEVQKNRVCYFKENKFAIFHNLGLQAKLLGYDVLYTDEFDKDLDIDIQEYLILNSGILTICK